MAEYRNWVPGKMIGQLFGGCALVMAGILLTAGYLKEGTMRTALLAILSVLLIGLLAFLYWAVNAYRAFSYEGDRHLSKDIVEGIASYAHLPEGGKGLDTGCGSGALTIAIAKRNPQAHMTGCDLWKGEYDSYSRKLCENNAKAEGISNVTFVPGNAVHLPFEDESFDFVTSNYVYHNIIGSNKQDLLRETLRVLKKGGTFVIHDLMSESKYGDMDAFVKELKEQGYQDVQLIRTDQGLFMKKSEAVRYMLKGSTLLMGRKQG